MINLSWAGWLQVQTPVGGKRSALLHANSDWPWGQPTLWYNGYCGFFLRVKWPRCSTEHPPPTSAEFKWVEHKGIPLTTPPFTSPCLFMHEGQNFWFSIYVCLLCFIFIFLMSSVSLRNECNLEFSFSVIINLQLCHFCLNAY